MRFKGLILALALSAGVAFAQDTPQLQAAKKLQADVQKALPSSSLTDEEKAKVSADADLLVKNATTRAQGGMPDRRAGRAAGQEIGKSTSKLQPADAEIIKQDLKALQAAAQ